MITSASCSIAPDSRRSESCGRLSVRCSSERLSCDSASTGHSSSFASALEAARDFADLLLARRLRRLRRAAHQLEVVDEDEAALLAAASRGNSSDPSGSGGRARAPRAARARACRRSGSAPSTASPRRTSGSSCPGAAAGRGAARDESTRASEHSMRSASCVDDISSENTRHGQPPLVAAFWASDSANDVLPIAGRAARMMSSVGCRPAVLPSRSAKPVGTPVMPSRCLNRSSSELNTFLTRPLIGSGPDLSLRCVTSKILASASSR